MDEKQLRIILEATNRAGPALAALRKDLDATSKVMKQVGETSRGVWSGLGRGLSAALGPVFSLFSTLLSVARAALGVVTGALRGAFDAAMGMARAIAGPVMGALRSMAGYLRTAVIAGVVGLAAALEELGRHGVGVNVTLQQVQIGLASMLKSTGAARQLVAEMQQYASHSTSTFLEIAQWGKRLVAFGFSAQEVVPILRDVGDAAAGLGIGAEGLERITLAFGQMRAKGKVSGEELMQLMEAGIPAQRYLNLPVGAEAGNLNIPAAAGIAAIRAGIQRDFGGMQGAMMETLPGRISNIKDAFNRLSAEVTSGLFESLRRAAGAVRDFLDGLERTRAGQTILRTLRSLFDAAGDAILRAAQQLPRMAQWLANLVDWVRANWPSVWQYAGQVWDWFVGVVQAGLEWIGANWRTIWDTAATVATWALRVVLGLISGVRAVVNYLAQEGVIPRTLQGWAEAFKGWAGTAVMAVTRVIGVVLRLGNMLGQTALMIAPIVGVAAFLAKSPMLGGMAAGLFAGGTAAMAATHAGLRALPGMEASVLHGINGIDTSAIGQSIPGGLAGLPGLAGTFGRAFGRSWKDTAGGIPGMPAFGGLTPFPGIPDMPGAPWGGGGTPAPAMPAASGGPILVPSRPPTERELEEDRQRYQPALESGVNVSVSVNVDRTQDVVERAVAEVRRQLQVALGARTNPMRI